MASGGLGKSRRARLVELRLGGMRNHEIASEMKVSQAAISATLKLPEVRAAIDEANHATLEAIADERGKLSTRALRRLAALMDGDPDPVTGEQRTDVYGQYCVPPGVQRQAARDILDACGFAKTVAVRYPDGTPTAQVVINLADLSLDQLRMAAWGEQAPEELVLDVVPMPEAK